MWFESPRNAVNVDFNPCAHSKNHANFDGMLRAPRQTLRTASAKSATHTVQELDCAPHGQCSEVQGLKNACFPNTVYPCSQHPISVTCISLSNIGVSPHQEGLLITVVTTDCRIWIWNAAWECLPSLSLQVCLLCYTVLYCC